MNRPATLVFGFAIVGVLVGCTTVGPKRNTFFVEEAAPAISSCIDVDGREAAIACNRIAEGRSLVVGVREYFDDGVDSERFVKVTMFLNGGLSEGEVFQVPSENVRVVFGSGLSFMPGKSGCYGEAKSGKISVVRRSSDQIEIDVDTVFDLKSPLSWNDACKEYVYRTRILAKRRLFDELGAWEGVRSVGDSVVVESRPSGR